jgi:hypothetical protein
MTAASQPEHVARLWDLTAANPTSAPRAVEGHQGVVFDSDFFPAGYTILLATGGAADVLRCPVFKKNAWAAITVKLETII